MFIIEVWLNKLWFICIMDYYVVVNRNEEIVLIWNDVDIC